MCLLGRDRPVLECVAVHVEAIGLQLTPHQSFTLSPDTLDDDGVPIGRAKRITRERHTGGLRIHHELDDHPHTGGSVGHARCSPIRGNTLGERRRPAPAQRVEHLFLASTVEEGLELSRERVLGAVFVQPAGTYGHELVVQPMSDERRPYLVGQPLGQRQLFQSRWCGSLQRAASQPDGGFERGVESLSGYTKPRRDGVLEGFQRSELRRLTPTDTRQLARRRTRIEHHETRIEHHEGHISVSHRW